MAYERLQKLAVREFKCTIVKSCLLKLTSKRATNFIFSNCPAQNLLHEGVLHETALVNARQHEACSPSTKSCRVGGKTKRKKVVNANENWLQSKDSIKPLFGGSFDNSLEKLIKR